MVKGRIVSLVCANSIALGAVLLAPTPARAAPVINVGSFTLEPNKANQVITLTASGGDAVTGFNLRAVLGNGTGSGAEPVFQSIAFGAGTLWTAHPATVTGGPVGGFPQDAQASVVFNTSGDTVPAAGNLVILTIDTTGLTGGTYALSLAGTEIGANSAFIGTSGGAEVQTTITNGSVTIAPEPAGLALLGLAGVLLARRRGGPRGDGI